MLLFFCSACSYFKSTLILVTLLYISFGLCGYLSFGPETNPIITLNLPKGQSVHALDVLNAIFFYSQEHRWILRLWSSRVCAWLSSSLIQVSGMHFTLF
jgi:hypothetical protein